MNAIGSEFRMPVRAVQKTKDIRKREISKVTTIQETEKTSKVFISRLKSIDKRESRENGLSSATQSENWMESCHWYSLRIKSIRDYIGGFAVS